MPRFPKRKPKPPEPRNHVVKDTDPEVSGYVNIYFGSRYNYTKNINEATRFTLEEAREFIKSHTAEAYDRDTQEGPLTPAQQMVIEQLKANRLGFRPSSTHKIVLTESREVGVVE
jgi:hypothetical protein